MADAVGNGSGDGAPARSPRRRSPLALAVLPLVVFLAACGGSTKHADRSARAPTTTVTAPTPSTVAAPPGINAPRATWLRADSPGGSTQLIAVFRPPGRGPFPAVLVLHGSSGLASVQLDWAEKLAGAGYLVAAGCYLPVPPGTPDRVPCSPAPDADEAIKKIVVTVEELPDVKPGALGVVGFSAGADHALDLQATDIKAIVADSTQGHATNPVAPVLLLAGTADTNVPVAQAHAFEAAMRAQGKSIEPKYYDGGTHVVLLGPTTTQDATATAIAFLDRLLK